MAIIKTARAQKNEGRAAMVNSVGLKAPLTWLKKAVSDMTTCPTLAAFYGILFTFITYVLWDLLSQSEALHDVAVPLIAMLILVLGPISALSLYDVSRRTSKGEIPTLSSVLKAGVKSNGSCPSVLLSVILIILALMWMLFSPLIYAVFTAGSLHIVGPDQSIAQGIVSDISNGNNMGFIIAYFIFTSVVGIVAFMISWFSFPMVLDQDVDPLTAVTTSLRAAMSNKLVMILWIAIVGVLILFSLFTPYFVGLVVVVPLLAHATWYAYKDMINNID
ncbi:DUF2189 domain-containing protein [Candidatus Thioglobus sp.]|uniref:DUF2189 domain-containing protein n=1 Tax=Candidatus Thioglobus sp. TaxID=2026721 RepID=UPI003D12B9DA